jgi:hypothetical protein
MAGTTDPPDERSREGAAKPERLLAIDEEPSFTPAPAPKVMPPMSFSTGDGPRSAFPHEADAPPLPVNEYPKEFVDTIRRFNHRPAADYFFSAYPNTTVATIDNDARRPRR